MFGNRSSIRSRARAIAVASSLAALVSCSDATTDVPETETNSVQLFVTADISGTAIQSVVAKVEAPDMETITSELEVEGGTATGVLSIPVGSGRVLTITAFNAEGAATHEGSRTLTVAAGTNETVSVNLVPTMGDQPITATLGEVRLTWKERVGALAIGSTAQFEVEVLEPYEDTIRVLDVDVTWGSLHPETAAVDGAGDVTGVAEGSAQILAVYGGVAIETWVSIMAPIDLAESIIAKSFVPTWNAQNGYDGLALPLSTMAWEHSASWGNAGMWQMSWYPREAWPNDEAWSYYDWIEDGWMQPYESAHGAVDGLLKLAALGVGDAEAARAKAFAHFVLGYSLGTIALTFDRGFVVDENADLENLQLQPYNEVMDAALDHFQTSIDISRANDFQLPNGWIRGNPLTSDELAQLAHSFMARYMTKIARYPDERDAVDWNAVIQHVDAGITEDFMIDHEADVWWDDVKIYGDIFDTWARSPYMWWGQADTSGGYESWMAQAPENRTEFLIVTPDLRYPQGSTLEAQRENPGTYLVNIDPHPFNAARGTWYFSYYRNARYDYYGAASYNAPTTAFNTEELDLIKAEALIRLGNPGAAADLINKTRVANGGLPPVTAAGVPDGPATCVPQMPDGSCGGLLEALKYEKRVENVHTHLGTWFFDSRGWDDLEEGTPVHVPIPAGILTELGEPVYTFGGVGGNCAAGSDCSIP